MMRIYNNLRWIIAMDVYLSSVDLGTLYVFYNMVMILNVCFTYTNHNFPFLFLFDFFQTSSMS